MKFTCQDLNLTELISNLELLTTGGVHFATSLNLIDISNPENLTSYFEFFRLF